MINQSFNRIICCILTLGISPSIFCAGVYWYNNTDKTIELFSYNEIIRKRLSPKTLYSFPLQTLLYRYENHENSSFFQKHTIKDIGNPVIIFESDATPDTESGIKVHAMEKDEFDRNETYQKDMQKYAQALKETQRKYTPTIQEGTALPSGVCGIVSEFYVDKPE